MKTIKILLLLITPLLFFACSEDTMDEINKERNNALEMSATSMLPDAILKTAFQTAGADMAWYTSVYVELNAGSWNQMFSADKRINQDAASTFNNSWNQLYDVMNICHDIIDKTAPDGEEPDNQIARGIAQVLMAYNLEVATAMWGEVPYTEALKGAENLKPAYDRQSDLYPVIQQMLDDAIATLGQASSVSLAEDLIYGGDTDAWITTAYSLKARYHMRLSQKNSGASADALTALANGFSSAADEFLFDAWEATSTGENPWYQFLFDRTHHSTSQSFYDMLAARNDPRISAYFTLVGDTAIVPCPNGAAIESQGTIYSQSLITTNGRTAPTPLMTYHELLFIKAEAEFRTGAATWQATLQQAVEESFTYHGVAGGTGYFTTEVVPLLTAGNELNEIIAQKYIAFYEHEAIEAYNDYRRTGVPSMANPNNATVGFVNRLPFPVSEVSSNPDNVPTINIFSDKVWFAGGEEKL